MYADNTASAAGQTTASKDTGRHIAPLSDAAEKTERELSNARLPSRKNPGSAAANGKARTNRICQTEKPSPMVFVRKLRQGREASPQCDLICSMFHQYHLN